MKRKIVFTLFIFLGFPSVAHAYIDPGTGSLLLQGIIAAFVSVLVFWRNLRMSIMSVFRGKREEKTQASSPMEKNPGQGSSDFKE